jgi:two-component system alkaline phosphatase synthesis response regulator PhoP
MSKKILVVDDDPSLIKMVDSYLSAHNYTVIIATDGDEGLAKIKSDKPDLIVLDVQMPKMNGYTFVHECKKIPSAANIPIIVLTAKQGMAEIFKVEGVKEYMTKPFAMEKLLECVKKHIS